MSLLCTRYRLHVTAESDPLALPRLIGFFQNLNVVPRKFLAEWSCFDQLHVEVDSVGLPEETIQLIVAKMREVPCVLDAHWVRV